MNDAVKAYEAQRILHPRIRSIYVRYETVDRSHEPYGIEIESYGKSKNMG